MKRVWPVKCWAFVRLSLTSTHSGELANKTQMESTNCCKYCNSISGVVAANAFYEITQVVGNPETPFS